MRRDEERRIQVSAVRALHRIADAAEAPGRAVKAAEHAAGQPPLRRIFAGERGAVLFLRSIPGFAELWKRAVPSDHITTSADEHGAWQTVRCVCGAQTPLRSGDLAECPGGCGRWFLHAGKSIRAKLFEAGPVAELDDAA